MYQLERSRWLRLWRNIGAEGDGDAVFEYLLEHYTDPSRAYHDLNHIIYCLNVFDEFRVFAQDPNAVEFAIWFHDVIYDTKGLPGSNEEASASAARDIILGAKLTPEFAFKVGQLIVATKHNAQPTVEDEKLITDIDLSSLGWPMDSFTRSTEQIRQEYNWASNEEFAKGRADFFRTFLNRQPIYSTQIFRNLCEKQARENMINALAVFEGNPRT